MYVTFATLALVLAGHAPTNKWMDDYAVGYRQASSLRKPLAVVVGRGTAGWQNLEAKGAMDAQIQRTLSDKYVCVYVDATLEKNKSLVQQLQTGENGGLVLSDTTGQYVAFRHVGTMTKDHLEGTLKRFSVEQQPAPAPAMAPVHGGTCASGACGMYSGTAYQPMTGYSSCGSSMSCGSGCGSSMGCASGCGSSRGSHRIFSRGGSCRGGSCR